LTERDRSQRLQSIYSRIARWSADDKFVTRKIAAVNPTAELAVVGEAPGPRTVRLSGVNYFDRGGRIGATGRYLDEILRPLGCTVYPPRDVKVSCGTITRAQGAGRPTVYCTDLCPVFPGYQSVLNHRQRIRRPSQTLVRSSIKKGFLRDELATINPRVILLLGALCYKHFYRCFLNESATPSLGIVVSRVQNVHLPMYGNAVVVPFLHPSPSSPAFLRWFERFVPRLSDSPLVKLISRSLRNSPP